MTFEEIKKLPPLMKERIKEIDDFKNTDFSDCPELTDAQLKRLKSAYDIHPEWFDDTKTTVQITIDNDILAALKAESTEYQARINAILRKAVLG